jgi:pyruvate/2-oxoglutarate/acetoin dehydrogenase E1 component
MKAGVLPFSEKGTATDKVGMARYGSEPVFTIFSSPFLVCLKKASDP